MAVTHEQLPTTPYLRFFQQRVVRMVTHWRDHDAVQQLEVAYLDREREAILKAINLGLDFAPAWPLVKPLIVALTPYMERRGHWDAWETVLGRALTVAKREADVEAETTLTALLARLCQRMSRPTDVIHYYLRVIRLARKSKNRYEEARACSNLGYFYIDGNRWWRSEILSCHALHIFETLNSQHGQAHTHNHLGILYTRLRKWPEAEHHLLRACELWSAMEDRHSLIYGYENLAVLYNDQAIPQRALPVLEKAEVLIQETGETAEIATVWTNLAYTYRLLGDVDRTVQLSNQAEALFREQLNLLPVARIWHNLALLYQATGDHQQAEQYRIETDNLYQHCGNEKGRERLRTEYNTH